MPKRVIFCTDRRFPRGDAGANRILNICRALQLCGHDTLVLSEGKPGCGDYEGIKYENLPEANGRLSKLNRHFRGAGKIVSLLGKYGVAKEDFVVVYTSNLYFAKPLFKFVCGKVGASCAADVVEWYQPFQLGGEKSFVYRAYKRLFENYYTYSKKVIAISNCLKEHFESVGCKCELIPIFVDTKEARYAERRQKDVIDLIYSGNPCTKDNFEVILTALSELPDDTKRRFRFHLTGMSEDILVKSAGGGGKALVDSLSDVLVRYKWLEYDELVELYTKMDFLFMAKPDNLVSKSNFPSKIPEMMAYGIAPIINRVGDICDYLTDGRDSVVFDRDTVEECKNALMKIASMSDDEISSMRGEARKTAEDKFDYRSWGVRITEFFDN